MPAQLSHLLRQWIRLGAIALCLAGVRCQRSQTRSEPAPIAPVLDERAPLVAMSCDEAKRFPQAVPTNDVRFLDCDQTARGTGEAFELGDPCACWSRARRRELQAPIRQAIVTTRAALSRTSTCSTNRNTTPQRSSA